MVIAGAAACRRAPAPPYSFSFALGGTSPRTLVVARESSVRLTLINTGQREWDPARVHFSYHWLWLVPRELAARSRWDVPYHDGIRTELNTRVPPQATVQVDARLLAPAWPGLYWLQWDMVEEGVTWFAQVSPRQPRDLVIVVPSMLWFAAPLPFAAALWGFVAIGRRQRFSSIADVVWCVTALAAKPLLVVHDALLEPTALAYWLIAAAAVVPTMSALLLPRRIRAAALLALGTLGSFVVLADVLYYRFFGDVLSAPALLAAGQTSHVWGSIRSLLSPLLLWLVIDLPLAAVVAARVSTLETVPPPVGHRVRSVSLVFGVLFAGAMLASVPRALASLSFEQTFRDRAIVEQLGVFGFHGYDLWNYTRATVLRASVTDDQMNDAVAWFRSRASMRAGTGSRAFGSARGRNVIVLQVESLQDFVVDYRAGGQEVMPNLRRWSADSLRYTNLTDQTSEGRTSDAEFTAMASLLPLDHGAVAFRYPGNHYTALPRVLTEHGYSTMSAVPFEPGFWNRQVMHPAYGFQRTLFEPDFEMTEQIGWGLNDRDFLRQMIPHLLQLQKPFAAWLITLSLHHPFADFPERHKTLKLGALEGTSFGNYLHTMHFFDGALAEFTRLLADCGLLDSSIVVVFGDHDAGFVRDPSLSRVIGIPADDIAWTLNDRVPLFVRVPRGAVDEDLHGTRSMPAGQTDIAPTILGLLGIDAASLPYVGRSLLDSPGGPVLRPYGEWLDQRLLFATRATTAVCRDLERAKDAGAAACANLDREARRGRAISRLVVAGDLQQRLRDALSGTSR